MLILAGCSVDLQRGRVLRGETELELTTRELDLLRYLVEHRSQVVSREQLLSEVWGYSDTVVSRASDNAVRRLREKVEQDPTRPDHLLTVHGVGYRFELPGETQEIAPVAPSLTLSLGPVRVDLTRRRVERPSGEVALHETEVALLRALIEAEGQVLDRRALAKAGWSGRAHSSRIVDAAIAQLRTKLELEPDSPRWLLTVRNRGYRLERPAPAASAPVAELVGRQALLQGILSALAPGKWVLLLGPAGIGKSSLARQTMAADERPALWVDLAAAHTPTEACTQVARALELLPADTDPVGRIGSALARRAGELVVLDNLEGLGAGARELLARWRAAAPGVLWLGTSRVRVGAEDETVIEVDPLALEDAVELFVRLASSSSSTGRIVRDQLPQVRQLVERLDRVPLALALAAARTSVMSVGELLERLDLDLLRRQGGDPRHSSLRLAIDASLRALPEDALVALTLLAGFRSGFFLDDAEGLLGDDAIDLIQLLRDHSLLRAEPVAGGLRFATWEAVREVLEETSHPENTRQLCAWMGRTGDPQLLERLGWDSHQRQTERLEAQCDDVAAAARAALALGEVELAARCAAAAAWAFFQRGPYAEGEALVQAALEAGPSGALRAWLHLLRAGLEYLLGRPERAVHSYMQAASLAAEYGQTWVECEALRRGARMLRHLGRLDEIRPLLVRAIDRTRERGARDGQLELAEAWLAQCDELPSKREALLRRAVALGRQAGHRHAVIDALASLADMAHKDGRLQEARDRLRLQSEIGIPSLRLQVQNEMGQLALAMYADDDDEVDRLFPLARLSAARLGSPLDEIDVMQSYTRSLLGRGALAQARTVLEQAEVLLGAEPGFEKFEAEHDMLWCELYKRSGQFREALDVAARAIGRYRALGRDDGLAMAASSVALAHLALGELAQAHTALQAAPRPTRLNLAHHLGVQALLARAEGDAAQFEALMARAREEAHHRGHTLRDGHEALVSALFGSWAVRLLTRS